MRRLVREKDMAIQLRKKGYSYAEIQKRVPVAKSSLSLWLKDTRLTEDEKRVLKRRKSKNIEKGRIKVAAILRKRRVVREQLQLSDAHRLYALHRSDPLFLVGVALYWAEGTKRSNSFAFINSDPHMITVMVEWLERFFAIPRTRIKARLYIHKHYAHEMCEEFWCRETGIPLVNFGRTIYKPSKVLFKKRPAYKGCLRLELGKEFRNKMIFLIHTLIEESSK